MSGRGWANSHYSTGGDILLRSSDLVELNGAMKRAQAGLLGTRGQHSTYEEFGFYIVNDRANRSIWKSDSDYWSAEFSI